MKNVIIFIMAVIIIFMGWAYYKSVMTRNQIILQSQNNTGYKSGWMLSVSLICKDNSHFVAEFPDAYRVNIIVDGQLMYTLPRVQGLGQRYENPTKAFVFAGEEATAIDKVSGKNTICTQPFDPNNAPVNFGDAGEGSGQTVDRNIPALVSQSISGKWKSTQDAKFVREFKSSGIAVDYYDGKKVAEGKWVVFDSAHMSSSSVAKVSFTVEPSAVYVQMIVSAASADNLNFKITKLTPSELELVYMEKGGSLTFTKE